MSAVRRTVLVLTLASMSSMSCAKRLVVRGSEDAVRPFGLARSPDRVFGETVRVTMHPLRLFGELIACDRDALYLRVHEEGDSAWRRVEWSERPLVDVALPSAGPAVLTWSIIGTVSTLSHGVFALISANVWAAAGAAATVGAWNPRLGLSACETARPFARFPQGLPASFVDRFNGVFDESRNDAQTPWSAPSQPATAPAPWATPTPAAPSSP